MPSLDVGDATLFYTDDRPKRGVGPPIVFVHGWTCDSHDWAHQFEGFAARHRVIALDLRGHGRSTAGTADFRPQTHAADLAEVLDHLDVVGAVVVGHSLGANIGTALAAARPDLAVALVCSEPAYGVGPDLAVQFKVLHDAMAQPGANETTAAAMAPLDEFAPSWVRAWHRRRILGMDPVIMRRAFGDIYFSSDQFALLPESEAALRARTQPVLAFHRLPEMAKWESQFLPGSPSEVICWEGAGHWLHQERPEAFNHAVAAWLARQELDR